MKPDYILKQDFNDILFMNRNQLYGAYVLRKTYSERLLKAVAGMLVLVTVFAVWLMLSKPTINLSSNLLLPPDIQLTEVQLEPIKPIEQKQLETYQPKKVASIKDVTPIIVPDKQIEHSEVPTVDEIAEKVIDSKSVEGSLVGANEVITATQIVPTNSNVTGSEVLEDNTVFEKVEIMPSFPGGMDAFRKFLMKNLRQPEDLMEEEKFLVLVSFVIDNEGNITSIQIDKSGRPDLDKEVVRVVKKMPKWNPGRQNGKNVAVHFRLPVTFIGAES